MAIVDIMPNLQEDCDQHKNKLGAPACIFFIIAKNQDVVCPVEDLTYNEIPQKFSCHKLEANVEVCPHDKILTLSKSEVGLKDVSEVGHIHDDHLRYQ